MNIPEQLHCLVSSEIERDGDSYRLEIPAQEVDVGTLEANETYRVAVLSAPDAESNDPSHERQAPGSAPTADDEPPAPPVREGEERVVEIESLGDQGDGITRVERGFVIIVPDTDPSERVRIEVTEVRKTVAFADVVERLSYYD